MKRSQRPASRAPRATASAALLVLAALLVPPAVTARTPPPAAEPQLAVHVPAISWSSASIHVTVSQQGALAGRRLAVQVFVDGNMIGRISTGGGVTRNEMTGLELSPGSHQVLVKSGTHEAADRFHYLPALYPAAAAGLIAVVALAAAALRRRRRASV